MVERLSRLTGMQAVVLGGSYARGRARPGSDIDLGLLYREAAPFSIGEIRELARELNDAAEPAVAGFYEWGQWVNGGTGLTVRGQRVDLLYENLDQLERVLTDARTGHHEQAYYQQPPFGFHSDTFLAELETCIPLFDPEGVLPGLQQRVAEYPEALRRRLVQDSLGGARPPSMSFAECSRLPPQFAVRVRSVLSRLGETREELLGAVERIRALARETEAFEPGLLAIGDDSPAWLRVQEQAGYGLASECAKRCFISGRWAAQR